MPPRAHLHLHEIGPALLLVRHIEDVEGFQTGLLLLKEEFDPVLIDLLLGREFFLFAGIQLLQGRLALIPLANPIGLCLNNVLHFRNLLCILFVVWGVVLAFDFGIVDAGA